MDYVEDSERPGTPARASGFPPGPQVEQIPATFNRQTSQLTPQAPVAMTLSGCLHGFHPALRSNRATASMWKVCGNMSTG